MPKLHWIGKEKVVNHHRDVPFRVLEHQYTFEAQCLTPTLSEEEEQNSSPWGRSGGAIIHGDNLEALKSLLPEYEGRVKCIYIDPPYNTGNEGWVYNDNVNDPKIRKWLNSVVGKEGEDLSRHDKWLCMMYPRLMLLHKLLADDGAIFISIDDNEQANLKLVCDEIFGGGNFIAQMVWQKRTSPDARRKISAGHEYIITYIKNYNFADSIFNLLNLDDLDKGKYKNPDNDPRGPWVSTDCTAQAGHGTKDKFYILKTPAGRIIELPASLCWRYTQQRINEEIEAGRIWFGKDGKGVPRKKTYLAERTGRNLWSWWPNSEVGHTQEATKEITTIFGKTATFDYPKPQRLLERIIQIATTTNDIILDSFAGSGTTAHAVLNLNKQDGGNRQFILIEMEDYAETITAERVRRVMNGYGEGNKAVEGTGGSFDYYTLGEPLFTDDHLLNEQVGTEKIRQYVWFTETHAPMPKSGFAGSENLLDKNGEKYLLGLHNNMAYYFVYEADSVTTLEYDLLSQLKTPAASYLIYADNCLLPKSYLDQNNIIFKKIPRDISRF